MASTEIRQMETSVRLRLPPVTAFCKIDASRWGPDARRRVPARSRGPVGSDVFVLGYPFGIGPGGFPIWKRGSIASEPGIINQHHIFLDTASRPGMSGSPIIRRSWGTHFYEDGGITTATGSTATKFVGVYSGRLASADPLDAQLGFAWPAVLLTQIVSGRKLDI
jgi:hypothetical protein